MNCHVAPPLIGTTLNDFLRNAAAIFKGMFKSPLEILYAVECDDTEVRLRWLNTENEVDSQSFHWAAVSSVDTFKRDLFTTDCICLGFQTQDGWFEVNEEMKGWSAFLHELESSLPGFPPGESWWRRVMLPAFETNHARLWTREARGHDNDAGVVSDGTPAE